MRASKRVSAGECRWRTPRRVKIQQLRDCLDRCEQAPADGGPRTDRAAVLSTRPDPVHLTSDKERGQLAAAADTQRQRRGSR